MKFTWDEEKRKANLVKHGIDFADAKAVFAGATFTFEDDRFPYGEQRFITLGMLEGKVVVIVHTERNKVIRVISMRKATRNE
ncbi:MAG: BrnT family toxin [bacterium]